MLPRFFSLSNVEVDETLIGGKEHGGKRGREAVRKTIVVIAVEVHDPSYEV
jgi:hypothetical protein